VIQEIAGTDPANISTPFGMFMFSRGLANILGGPISSGMMGKRMDISSKLGFGVDAGHYAGMILLVGR
jgi:hypothetical protein